MTLGSGARPPPVAELYARHGRLVLRRIRRFYADPHEAEEVLHEVFERVLVAVNAFRGESSITTWLYAITTRHCLIRLRDSRRRTALFEAAGAPDWSRPVQSADQEVVVFVRSLWRSIDEELALIGLYYYVDGMSQAEIGALLGVTGRTVSNRLRTLQERLAAEEAPR
ncbi:MAG: sigma-70 family RNA polymerase sigma factor [Myxococcota bacterium]